MQKYRYLGAVFTTREINYFWSIFFFTNFIFSTWLCYFCCVLINNFVCTSQALTQFRCSVDFLFVFDWQKLRVSLHQSEWSVIRISTLLPNKEVYYRNKFHIYWYSFLVQGITNFQNNILEIYATNLISKLYNASILFSQYFWPISLSRLKDFLA